MRASIRADLLAIGVIVENFRECRFGCARIRHATDDRVGRETSDERLLDVDAILRQDDGCFVRHSWRNYVCHCGCNIGDIFGCDENKVEGRCFALRDVGDSFGDYMILELARLIFR